MSDKLQFVEPLSSIGAIDKLKFVGRYASQACLSSVHLHSCSLPPVSQLETPSESQIRIPFLG